MKAKILINKYFNIGQYITTIRETNMSFFLQNICKNKLLTDTILENNKTFDILSIQELSWSVICQIPSFTLEEGSDLIDTPHHPS